MHDEEIDKIVKDAASQHHPPYDDTAWGKMEVLLDKHLPQKKDRKRPFIFLLSLLLMGSAIFFIVNNTQNNSATSITTGVAEKPLGNTNNSGSTIPATDNNSNVPAINNTASNTALKQPAGVSVPTTGGNYSLDATPKKVVQAANKNDNALYAGNNNKRYNQKSRLAVKIKKPGAAINADEDNAQLQNKENGKADNDSEYAATETAKKDNLPDTVAIINTTDKQSTAAEKTDSITKTTTEAEKVAEKKKPAADKKKNKKSFADNFAITLSAGADVSFININNAGKLKPMYGAGLSYAAGKHFAVNAGLYISKKIYSAAPSQYKFPGGTSYPYLVKIDGDCNVYEIPLTVYYNFKQVKNHNWLAGIGISSLLMKKESYDYIYKTPSGQSYNYVHAVSNENKHYFSVLTLSGGYRYTLSNRISFIAEPYLKLPLGGVGEGKIKLNSTGILLTGTIKPFIKGKQ